MTLTRQLFAGITAAFLALLLGIEAIYVSNARVSLEQQLDAHANETATSLALSLGARFSTLDATAVNIMVNPVFDRGHFQSIEVLEPDGAKVFGRELEARAVDVPPWFVALVSLQGPRGEALITSRWQQLGKVVVRVHPGYAYRQLYDTAIATLAWLAVLFALALAAVRYHLAGILKPLREIERAATEISNRNFVSITIEPRTRELQRVTRAINSLSAKTREAIAEESGRAERLRREAFEDTMTGQLNRRGFEQAVTSAIGEGGEIHSGVLGLFSLSGMEEINRIFGLTRGNEILIQLAQALAAPGDHAVPLVGRWQGPTLAAFLPNATSDSGLAWAEEICTAFAARLQAEGLPSGAAAFGGIVHFSGEGRLAELAKAAETALAQSARQGTPSVVAARIDGPGTGVDLKGEIETSIAANRITLLGQKVISVADQGVTQMEILSSLTGGDGKAISAAVFVPAANQHGLLAALDRKVIDLTLVAMRRDASLPAIVSVNVSMQSIADEGFRAAIRVLLSTHAQSAARLVFEITGYAASRSPELTRAFAAEIRALGAQVALDNFEIDRNSMAIVHDLLPAYIKLAVAFTQEIGVREDLRFIVEALVRMLRPLEIPLIAQGVEDPAAIAVLGKLGLAAYQGYAGGRPQPLAQ